MENKNQNNKTCLADLPVQWDLIPLASSLAENENVGRWELEGETSGRATSTNQKSGKVMATFFKKEYNSNRDSLL